MQTGSQSYDKSSKFGDKFKDWFKKNKDQIVDNVVSTANEIAPKVVSTVADYSDNDYLDNYAQTQDVINEIAAELLSDLKSKGKLSHSMASAQVASFTGAVMKEVTNHLSQ
jgi:hypothetical protein